MRSEGLSDSGNWFAFHLATREIISPLDVIAWGYGLKNRWNNVTSPSGNRLWDSRGVYSMYLYMKHSANHFPTSIDERTTVHDIGLYPCKVLSYEPEIIFSPYQRTDADVIALSLWMEWVPMEWVPKGVSWANQSDQNDNPTRYRLLGSRLSRIPNLTDPCPPKSQPKLFQSKNISLVNSSSLP